MDFRKVLARIFFLEFVAQTFKMDASTMETAADAEMLMGDGDKKKQELSENLVGNTQTSLRIIGGCVKITEVQQLTKLIFRGTRGKALVQTC